MLRKKPAVASRLREAGLRLGRKSLGVGGVYQHGPHVDTAAHRQHQVRREDVVPCAADIPCMKRTGRDGVGAGNDAVVVVPHHVGPCEYDVLRAEIMVHSKIEIVRVVDAIALVETVIDRKRIVGCELAILEGGSGIRLNHAHQLRVDQSGWNLITRRTAWRLDSVARLAKAKTGSQQRHRAPRRIAAERHSRICSRLRERIVNRTRGNARAARIHGANQAVGEIAGKFRRRRHVHVGVVRCGIPPALVPHKEERLVALDRASKCAAELMLRIP